MTHDRDAAAARRTTAEAPSPAEGATADADGSPGPGDTVVVRVPVDVRNIALSILAVLGVLAVLRLGQEVLVPFVVGIILSFILDGPVTWLARFKIPRAVGAIFVIVVMTGATGFGLYSVSDDARAVLSELPETAQKVRLAIQKTRERDVADDSAAGALRQAVEEIDRTVEEAAGPRQAPPGVTRVQIEEPQFRISEYLRVGTLGMAELLGQLTVVIFLVYFILVVGDLFKRKLVKLAGPTLSRKKLTVEVLDRIRDQIARFLFVRVITTVAVALATWAVLGGLGVERAGFLGLLTAILNTVPYFGPLLATAIVALVSLIQFEPGMTMALVAGGATFVITGLEGMLLTPALVGKAGRMNAVAVFVGLLFWGWLWGIWGLLLAVPALMVFKTVCDHVEDLHPIGELLGD